MDWGQAIFFLFCFAGHGFTHEGRHLLLCPQARMSRLRFLQQVVPIDLLKQETERPGLDRVLILDACRTDLLTARGAAPSGLQREQVPRDLVAAPRAGRSPAGSLALLCACSEGGQAGELLTRGHGLFTAALLEVLDEALAAQREVLLDDWLEGRLCKQMERLAQGARLPGVQRPWVARTLPPPMLIGGASRAWPAAAHERPKPVVRPAAAPAAQESDREIQALRERIEQDLRECERALLRGGGTKDYLEKVYSERLPDWRRAADLGWPDGQYLLGRCHEEGLGIGSR